MDELDELRAALHTDPRGVAEEASRIAATARTSGDATTLSRSLSVLGRARRSLGEIDLARTDLQRAIEAGRAAENDELVADAHVGLAGVLSFAGRFDDALHHLDAADQLGSERVRAYAALQRAIIEQRHGRMDAALAAYDAALPTLRRANARVDVAMVLANRGVIRTQTGELDGAVADLSEASEILAAEGHAFGVAQAGHGLGWAHARRGDLPRALGHLDRAIEQFADLGHAALEVHSDRVEVLLAAGLSAEAVRLGVLTAEQSSAAGNHAQAAETWLRCAQAARLEGDRVAAVEYADRARRLYAEQGAEAGERAARLEALRLGEGGAPVDELCGLASELEAAGNTMASATALALACTQAAADGAVERADALAHACARRAHRLGVLEVRLLAAHAAAACAEARGEPAAARRHVRTGLDDLRRHRASLGATDARVAVTVHARQLNSLGLRLALREGKAPLVLQWLERVRAGRRRHPPARPPDDADLAADLAALRVVAADASARELGGGDSTELRRYQRRLEQDIHRRQLRVAGDGTAGERPPPGAAEVREALDGKMLVEVADVDGRLIAVTVGPRRAHLADLGPAEVASDATAAITVLLRALVDPSTPSPQRVALVARLRLALGVLSALVSDLVPGDDPVVLVVPPGLHAVPWSVVPGLAGRPVSVAPSATWYVDATGATARSGADGPVVTVAGPRLQEAEREATDVARCYPRARTLTGADATADAVLTAMPSAPVAHLAAHGRLRHDNPLWSSLELADGPLCLYDLERLPQTPPVVVLSSCDSGVELRTGEELLGFATSLLNLGTQSLVASVCPLPDSPETRSVMTALHRGVAKGDGPGIALAEMSVDALEDGQTFVPACLTCLGAA